MVISLIAIPVQSAVDWTVTSLYMICRRSWLSTTNTNFSVFYQSASVSTILPCPVVLDKIMTVSGKDIYTGVAKRSRVQDWIKNIRPMGKDRIPGAKVQIRQATSIAQARSTESRIIIR